MKEHNQNVLQNEQVIAVWGVALGVTCTAITCPPSGLMGGLFGAHRLRL
jgi:hypothetical protein